MADSSNLLSKAREILESPSHEELEYLVTQLSKRQESGEFQSATTLYNLCVSEFPNCLALRLLGVYRASPNRVVRFRSIYLLAKTLTEFRNRNLELSLVTLREIKPLLISCLTMQETREIEIKIFRRVVSCVAVLDHCGWDELSDCILYLTDTDPLHAFHVFIDLPPVYDSFIFGFMDNIQEEAYKVLHNPEEGEEDDWSLALQCAVKMGIQLLNTELRPALIMDIRSNLYKSARMLVEKGMKAFLVQGLDNLESFLARDKVLYQYNKHQRLFVSSFMFKIRKLGTLVKYATRKINQFLKEKHKSVIQLSPPLIEPEELDLVWCDHFRTLSPFELLRIVASTDLEEEKYRELAIIRLNDLVSDHRSGAAEIDISVMRELQPLLISCLKEEGVSDSIFKILGQVVNHVANEVFEDEGGKCDGLSNYLASESKTDFKRAVYVFECVTVPLEDEFFIQLFPEIRTRLEAPRDLLVDDGCWVVAFKCAFCAVIHFIEDSSHAGYVKDTANQMIRSVGELVERGMEAELVREAFRETESIVTHQMELYATCEYKFIKGLLWRLYETQGLKMESKLVLWRINVRLDRGVCLLFKELLTTGGVDWLNQPLVD